MLHPWLVAWLLLSGSAGRCESHKQFRRCCAAVVVVDVVVVVVAVVAMVVEGVAAAVVAVGSSSSSSGRGSGWQLWREWLIGDDAG